MSVASPKRAGHRYSSIDEILGDSTSRFFGSGFRSVRHEVVEVSVDTGERAARARARIEYPPGWSSKNSRELQPHLSSLDALTIGAQVCEVYVRSAYGIRGGAADRLWLARSTQKPSNTPTTDLTAVPVTAALLWTQAAPDSLCGHLSSFNVQVGSIGLELVIDHPIVQPSDTTASWAAISEVLGAPESRYFGSAYAATQLGLNDIEFDAGLERVRAVLDLQEPPGGPALRGMGAAYFPFVSPANTIVGIAQLAQAMLYLYDDISREVSHNLWMRKITLDHPRPAAAGPGLQVQTWATKMSLLSIKGVSWRSGSFALTMPGIDGTYNLAHQLPDGCPSATTRETSPHG
jgi:hypothetical protein